MRKMRTSMRKIGTRRLLQTVSLPAVRSSVRTGRMSGLISGLMIGVIIVLILVTAGACKKHSTAAAPGRSFRMGFAASAPKPDITDLLQSLNLWPQHADAMIISTEVPWDSLLAGEDPAAYVQNGYIALLNYVAPKNLKLWIYIDPENGLDRQSDSDPLVAAGKSIAQPAMQQLYRRFVVAMDSLLHPAHLGLALETNLIRAAAPDSVYQGVKTAVNAAAADVRRVDPNVPLSVSIQAEVAWGKLAGSNYLGAGQDFTDFPFVQELGISSYPYFSFSTPADLPLNYYSRLVEGHPVPVFVSEGGWSSMAIPGGTNGTIPNTPAAQADYITRQGQLLAQAGAIALFQLTYTDLEISAWPATDAAGLAPFAWIGLVDSSFNAKPSLAAWDALLKQPLQQGH